ncbi:formyltetrahydrofolate deformylase [uncultured Methylobacterium sp.]|uniref:formyltetrahydrofolate deformylase n=1 Tax=uncultured Methylobacterium sp. TaxID=157278 RepID=UPI0025999C8F|nr:formyltetrahydrofolate deformylase [uncultured Methylobacterium sp.]
MPTSPPDYVLTLSCPDQLGLVHAVATFLVERRCNIADSAQFCEGATNTFFMRVSFSAPGEVDGRSLGEDFAPVADRWGMTWRIHHLAVKPRLLLMVSKFGHCLNDLLFRYGSGTLPVEIPAIVSNHRDYYKLAASYDIPFHYIPVTAGTKASAEDKLMEIVDRERVDLVVLARYMQVLSNDLCARLDGRAINIHHSFLPSFKGAKPYHQAHARGVKLIGATAHYVTTDLDEGPIIEQDVSRADHFLTPDDLVAVGRDVEAVVLSRAIKFHVEHRVLLSGRRTVVFK